MWKPLLLVIPLLLLAAAANAQDGSLSHDEVCELVAPGSRTCVTMLEFVAEDPSFPWPVDEFCASEADDPSACERRLAELGDTALPPALVLASPSPAVIAPDAPAIPRELRAGRSLGDPGAPVKVVLFDDVQCPPCTLVALAHEPLLIADLVADGTVYYTYMDFPFLGEESFDAAVAMRAAEALGGSFWDYRAALAQNVSGINEGGFTRQRLADIAELVGIGRQAFLEELDDPMHLAAVEAELDEGRALGVTSVPTLIINGELMAGLPEMDQLRSIILEAAATADAGAGSNTPTQAPEAEASPAGQICVEYLLSSSDDQPLSEDDLVLMRKIVEARLAQLGVPEPAAQAVDPDSLSVTIPNTIELEELTRFIGAPAVVEFVPVPSALFGLVQDGQPLPEGMEQTEPLFSGDEIASASIGEDEQTLEKVIDLELTPQGAQLLDAFAEEHFGDQLALTVGDIVLFAPTINAIRFEGEMRISGGSGGWTEGEAASIARMLRQGALPVEFEQLGSGTCS